MKLFLIICIGGFLSTAVSKVKSEGGKNMEHTHDLVENAKAFPASGKSYHVDFGEGLKFRLDFKSDKEMNYTSLTDAKVTEKVAISVTKLRENLFLVTWTEIAGNTVVHIEDFEKMQIYTNITTKDGSFYRKRGPLKLL